MNNPIPDKTEFSEEMSTQELETGEKSHQEIENHRRLVMAVGLTKDSSAMKESLLRDLDSYLNVIDLAEDTIDHYNDVIELLSLSTTKLRIILEEQLQELPESLTIEQKKRISKILNVDTSTLHH